MLITAALLTFNPVLSSEFFAAVLSSGRKALNRLLFSYEPTLFGNVTFMNVNGL